MMDMIKTGTDYTGQLHDLNIHGVVNIVPVLNRAFKHLFYRLTTDIAPLIKSG